VSMKLTAVLPALAFPWAGFQSITFEEISSGCLTQ